MNYRTYQKPPSSSALPRPPKIIGKLEKSIMEGEVVPVVIGKQKVQGKILLMGSPCMSSNINKLSRYGDMQSAYLCSTWYAIAMGKLSLVDIYANDKLLEAERDYTSSFFNDGTQEYKPRAFFNFLTIGLNRFGSINGIDWQTVDNAWPEMQLGCKYVNGYYVVTGFGNFIIISKDTIKWTVKTVINANYIRLYDIDYMDGRYVVVGRKTDTLETVIYYSDDLDTWSSNVAVYLSYVTLRSITNNGSLFVAVGDAGIPEAIARPRIQISPDGVTWTERGTELSPNYPDLKKVIYDGTQFVACGVKSGNGYIYYSMNGTTGWTANTPAALNGRTVYGIDYCQSLNKYTICCDAGKIFYGSAVTGINSSATLSPVETRAFNSIISGLDINNAVMLVAVGQGMIYSSVNGTSWTRRKSTDGAAWRAVCYNPDFVKNIITKLNGISHIYLCDDSSLAYDMRVVANSDGKAPEMKFVVISDYTASVVNSPMIYQPDVAETEDTFLGINPVAAIYEILTNKQWGLGLDAAHIDPDSFNHCADSFVPTDPDFKWRRYGVNLTMEDVIAGQEVIDKICQMTDLVLYCENDKFYLKLLYDSSASSVASFTDDDMQDVVISRQGWRELNNVVEGEYVDASLNFQKKQLTYKNDAAIEMAEGIENRLSTDVSYFINSIVAAVRLNEVLQREAIPKLGFSCSINRKGYALRRGDIITISNIEHGLTNVRFRINSITLGKLSDMNVKVEAIQVYEDLFDGNYKNIASAAGQVPQSDGSFLGAGGSASAVSENYFTASEDISVENGEVLVNIFKDSDGNTFVRKANASAAGVETHGFIQTSILTGFQVPVFFEGVIEGLTVDSGTDYFLSAADPGKLTSTAPSFSGQAIQRIGRSISETQIKFEPYIPIAVSNA
jgi:hypothetical protein